MKSRARNLIQKRVVGVDGDIGGVEDLYFDDERWVVRYLAVRTGEWLSEKPVLISPLSIRTTGEDDSPVLVNLSQAAVAASPDVDEHEPISRRFEIEFSKHFEYPIYWAGGGLWGGAMNPVTFAKHAMSEEEEREALSGGGDESHLRSANEVTGYHVHSENGSAGHVHDFLLDAETWAIDEIIVDTRNWFPGKKVLIEPDAITEIVWSESIVNIAMNTDEIKESPSLK